MGCGCGGGSAAKVATTKYEITGDPQGRKYLTEREAKAAAANRQLEGEVVPVKS